MKIQKAFVQTTSNANELSEDVNSVLANIYTFLDRVEQAVHISVYSSSVANDPVTVQHSLGEVPDAVYADVAGDMGVYATEEDRALWTSSAIVVRGSAASKLMKLRVVKF